MKRLFAFMTAVVTVAAAIAIPVSAHAQNRPAIEKEVLVVSDGLNNSFNAHDINAYMSFFAKPVGLLVIGGRAYELDSLRATFERAMSSRTNEAWTVDHAQVIVLSGESALLQQTYSGHFTLTSGVTWEYRQSAFITALVQKRGGAWKIVAFQNSASGTQVKK